LAGELGIDLKTHFFGEASPDQIIELLNGSLFVVVPSRREPFGIVALEALAAGKAMLASDTDGLGEFLSRVREPNVTLIQPTIEGLTSGLRKLFISNGNGSPMASNQLPEQYSWANVARRYEHVLVGSVRA